MFQLLDTIWPKIKVNQKVPENKATILLQDYTDKPLIGPLQYWYVGLQSLLELLSSSIPEPMNRQVHGSPQNSLPNQPFPHQPNQPYTHPTNKLLLLSFLFAFSLYLPCVCHSVCALILWGNSCSPRFSIFLTTPPLSIIDRAVRRSTEANPSYNTRQRILCYKDPVTS